MQVVLIMLSNGGERRSFSVVRSTTTIGRREDCDLRIPVGDVSRKHCRLVLTDDNVRIQDLGSSNGSFVNGQQVQDAYLNAGDTLSVGPVNFVVQIDGVPSEDQFDAPTLAVGDTGAGGTALALDALTAGELTEAEPAEGEPAEVAGTADLLEEVPEEPAVADDLTPEAATVDEVPAHEISAHDVAAPDAPVHDAPVHDAAAEAASAFDRIEIDDVEPAAAADDWDFLIEEPEPAGSHVDLHVDLDQPHDHHPPA